MSLQNTKWQFNSSVDFQGRTGTFQIYFELVSGYSAYNSMSIDYSTQEIHYLSTGGVDDLAYGYDDVLGTYGWYSDDFRSIFITGGTDVENQQLISFIDDNATEIPPQTFNITYNLTRLSTVGAPTTIIEYTSEEFRITVPEQYEEDYTLPATISVTGCDYEYAQGYVRIYNPYDTVIITASAGEIPQYAITFDLTNITYSGDTTIRDGRSAEGTLTAQSGYVLPDTIQVEGALYNYNKNTGVISFSDPTGNVTVTANAAIDPASTGITLLKMHCDNHVVDKSQHLTYVAHVTGTLRTSCSVIRPKIMFELSGYPQANYCYIPDFQRYYFILNITSVRQGLWELELNCDVLMSYRARIKELTAIIARQEYSYNPLLLDTERPISSGKEISIISSSTLSPFNVYENKYRYIALTTTNVTGITAPSGYYQKSFMANNKYLLNETKMNELMGALVSPNFAQAFTNLWKNNPLESLSSIKAYPFDLLHFWDTSLGSVQRIYLLSYDTNVDSYVVDSASDMRKRVLAGTFNVSSGDSWEAYTASYDIFLPFYGFTSLDAGEILDKTVTIYYIPDFDTGIATINIFADSTLIQMLSVNIAVDIPFGATNAQDVLRNLLSYSMSMAIGLAGAVATGGSSLPSVAQQATSGMDIIIPHVSRGGQSGGAWSASGQLICYIIKTANKYVTPTNWGHLHGYPSMQSARLGDLTGFTRVESVHVEQVAPATADEQSEIARLLQAGVIL